MRAFWQKAQQKFMRNRRYQLTSNTTKPNLIGFLTVYPPLSYEVFSGTVLRIETTIYAY